MQKILTRWPVLVLVGLCLLSVVIRLDWFGELSSGKHSWLTEHSINALRSWWIDGAWNSFFLNLPIPPSPIFSSLEERMVYVSYPPGHLLFPHLLSTLLQVPPSPSLLMAVNLVGHFLTAFFVFLLVDSIARKFAKQKLQKLIALVAASIVLFSAGPSYWLQNVYFADQAVIPFFSAFLFFEYRRLSSPHSSKWAWAVFTVGLLGGLTDFLFFILLFLAFLNRLFQFGLRNLVKSWDVVGGALLALGLFVFQLGVSGLLSAIIEKARFRMGLDEDPGAFSVTEALQTVLTKYVTPQFGDALWILSIVLFVWAFSQFKDKVLRSVLLLSWLGPLAIVMLLPQHQIIHNFSVLKFIVPVSIALGAGVSSLAVPKAGRLRMSIFLVAVVFVVGGFRPTKLYGEDVASRKRCEELRTVFSEVPPRSVVVSTEFNIEAFPPLDLACAGHGVKKVPPESLLQLPSQLAVDVFVLQKPGWKPSIEADLFFGSPSYNLFRISASN